MRKCLHLIIKNCLPKFAVCNIQNMLYTKKGDKGTTKLFDTPQGVRISKGDAVFEVLGALDELNSMTGLCKVVAGKERATLKSGANEQKIADILTSIQNLLFTLQARVAGSDKSIKPENVTFLEDIIAQVEEVLPPITTFLLSGGSELSAYLDVLRTLARKTERALVRMREAGEEARAGEAEIQFLNRLSSVFYALARYVNHVSGLKESPPEYA